MIGPSLNFFCTEDPELLAKYPQPSADGFYFPTDKKTFLCSCGSFCKQLVFCSNPGNLREEEEDKDMAN